MTPAIRVEHLAKLYRLGELSHHSTLGEGLAALFRPSRADGKAAGVPDEVWALEDVSFEVAPGEVVGIIGRNGAGKSTLLKILSRITEPTAGAVELRGRVSSLLEVGTGFHPELTGRENVYLNGSILGMRKAEIDRKFDRIVDFAGVERFLDTPVKRYSSGMQVRLAFAVAAHLEPEILIVDEVLAVGDAEFQRKCLGKMGEVAGDGRTVLFVSHNMAAVENLCLRGIVLDQGRATFDGPIGAAVRHYLGAGASRSPSTDLRNHPNRKAGHDPILLRLTVADRDGRPRAQFPIGASLQFVLDLHSRERVDDLRCGLHLYNESGIRVLTLHTYYQERSSLSLCGSGRLVCSASDLRLLPGEYSVVVALASGQRQIDRVEPAAAIEILPSDFFVTGRMPRPGDGLFAVPARWQLTC